MTISIWRYSHLALAISSFAFIGIASLTGIILAFEPISNQLEPYAAKNIKNITLAQTITVLQKNYDEIIEIEIDNNDFVSTSVITKEGKNKTFYVDPLTGKKVGDIIEKEPVFKFVTNLHRSLFLKSTGRFFVGLVSLILFLIATTGVLLIIKRQQGIRRFFSKVIKENFEQYYHIQIGRLTLIPIIIIALTGVYLSLEKFSLLPSNIIKHQIDFENIKEIPKQQIKDFKVFNQIQLKNVRKVEFPFSDDREDYFHIKLSDKELNINQFTGEILSKAEYPFNTLLSHWSMVLHTGQGSILWSIILLISSCSILFFMYSGFLMTLKRRKKSLVLKNVYHKDKSEYIILVGSETGNTFDYAKLCYNALIDLGKTVFISELNKYSSYKTVEHLIVFTATYGKGEPPANAKSFELLFKKNEPKKEIKFSVIGFGSLAYPDFCKYAIDVDKMLQSHPKFKSIIELYTINNQSYESFKNWSLKWGEKIDLPIQVKQLQKTTKSKNNKQFIVVHRSPLNIDNTFILRLRPEEKIQFQSGDLLAFYPEGDDAERLYSIGKIDDDILLSIKKHEFGICSTYFSKLSKNDNITASIKRNPDFNFPTYAKEVIMIANGTGIAPFLGMISQNNKNIKTHLFWGGRNKQSNELYNETIRESLKNSRLTTFYPAYSRAQQEKIYVQHLLKRNSNLITKTLDKNGVVLICGSVIMQKEVINVLDEICREVNNKPIGYYQNKGQLKMDCY
ncbi:sulfite reductase (NADPH) flavoprotein alpha-component [Aquimarina sp. MAR_2010_214]|uniref:PepSY domain-containing protein n=1 Tax=Aquimarina sp. MAR_2010_214 TaxID=1250026 RepID=UPI000C6FF33B|nr:PepSY domain-containing protein [Aquimarina sp. MAR_2010_214]PKV49242.1 sulfite reductase (NADPH) flavoprotein alpha-component [Aquimarina sp. MAR_2010_214]